MRIIRIVAAVFAAVFCTGAYGQTWPARPVTVFIPGPAGSAPDIVARLLAEKLVPMWGQQIVVDDRPGAAGNIGTAAGAAAPADGHNLLFGMSAALAINQFTFKSLPFNPEKDFAPIVLLGTSSMLIAVNNDLPVKSIADLIAMAKAQPGKINFATSSSRNVAHLTGEILAQMAGIKLTHVPYRTNALAASETIAGLSQVYIDGVPPMVGHMKSGRLRVLGVSSAKRLAGFPDIPTIAETVPGFDFSGWFGLVAPAGTSPQVIARVAQDVNTVLKLPEVSARLAGLGIYDGGGTPEEFGRYIRAQREGFGRAVKAAGIQPE